MSDRWVPQKSQWKYTLWATASTQSQLQTHLLSWGSACQLGGAPIPGSLQAWVGGPCPKRACIISRNTSEYESLYRGCVLPCSMSSNCVHPGPQLSLVPAKRTKFLGRQKNSRTVAKCKNITKLLARQTQEGNRNKKRWKLERSVKELSRLVQIFYILFGWWSHSLCSYVKVIKLNT